MTESDLEKLDEMIFQIRYLLSQGNCPNGIVSVCANEEDAAALERILVHCRKDGTGAVKMSREECVAVAESFNTLCPSLPSVRTVTEARMRALQSAKSLLGTVSFEELFRCAEASDFISGRSGKWRGASFDWILKKANLVKILEGNYDNAREQKQNDVSFDVDQFFDAALRRSARLIDKCAGGGT